MSDLIDRQAAIDEMAELQGRASSKGELTGISKAWKRIKQLPSAQCDITRCKFCTYFKSDFWCAWWEGTTSFNDYCSKGERRE